MQVTFLTFLLNPTTKCVGARSQANDFIARSR
jgi:hypothetical protein